VTTVVKLGGSLLDLPDLRSRLTAWLDRCDDPVLVVGGWRTADVVRDLDAIHGLGEERSHWLALRALTLNAHIVAGLLPRAAVATDLVEIPRLRAAGRVPILEPFTFVRSDETVDSDPLPHKWIVTTDSVAARAARRLACNLVLLKSAPLPPGTGLIEAARLGLVDEHFPREATHLSRVECVDFRSDPPLARPLL